MSMELLRSYIKSNEGVKLKVYNDSTGHKTIGAGFNLESGDAKHKLSQLGLSYEQIATGKQTISKEHVNVLLQQGITKAMRDAISLVPNFDQLNRDRQIVLIDLAFNLGRTGLSKFVKMLKAIKENNWEKASEELKNSRWFVQTGKRGRRNVEALRTGKLNFFNSEKPKDA